MNIVLLANEFPPNIGGLATLTYNMAKQLVNLGNKLLIISFPPEDQQIGFDSPPEFTDVKYFPRKLFHYGANVLSGIGQMIHRNEVDALYSITFTPEFSLIGSCCSALRLPWVSHAIGLDLYTPEFSYVLARKVTYKLSKAVICLTKYQKDLVCQEGAFPHKVFITYCGVDTSLFKFDRSERIALRKAYGLEDRFVLLCLGRLISRKGFDDAIKALTYLRDLKDLTLVIVGAGPEHRNLVKLAKNMKVNEKVLFLGLLSSTLLSKIYNVADVFVAPFKVLGHDLEGSPLVIKEAQATSLPIIVSKTPGSEEVVKNGEDGFVVGMSAPSELAQRIRVLYVDQKLRCKMGKNARDKAVKTFDWKIAAEKVETILRTSQTI
jgi:phosphatidylinositol alpha-1,6-mannosyltransferase